MGIMAYSLLWVMQDFVHQPNHPDLNIIQISITRSLHRRRCTALPFSATRNLKREQPERLLMAQLVRGLLPCTSCDSSACNALCFQLFSHCDEQGIYTESLSVGLCDKKPKPKTSCPVSEDKLVDGRAQHVVTRHLKVVTWG